MISAQSCDQAPIHCLPDEILEVIFLINTSKLELVEQGIENHLYDPHSTTLATAQVCQRWRAVALDYPIIWSRIINYEQHSPLWIETLLARSGSTLIDVGGDSIFEPIRLQYPRTMPVLQSIFKRTASLKTVSLCISHALWEPICHSFLGHPAPNLEFLFLMTSRTFPDCLNSNPLFANEAPCLRRLHLQRCLIDFSSSALSNLTELSVRDVTPRSVISASARLKAVPSVAEWLRVLKNIPGLRFLTLSSAISHLKEHEQPLPVVDLPHLSLLKLSTRFYSGIDLIDHLNIPPLCGIEFRLCRDHSSSTVALDGPKLLSFLSKQLIHWPQNGSDRYLQAKILGGGKIHFGNSKRVCKVSYVTESDVVEEHSWYSKDPILLLVLAFDSLDDSFGFFNQLLELYKATFSTTTTLDLWLGLEFVYLATVNGSFPAFHTFNSFTNVKTLNLLEQSPQYLLPLFQHSSLPLFPALQSLDLSGTDFEDGWGVMRDTFIKFLLWRVESGIPLAEIKMLGGYMSSQTAEDLSRIGNLRVTLDSMSLHYANTITDPYNNDLEGEEVSI